MTLKTPFLPHLLDHITYQPVIKRMLKERYGVSWDIETNLLHDETGKIVGELDHWKVMSNNLIDIYVKSYQAIEFLPITIEIKDES